MDLGAPLLQAQRLSATERAAALQKLLASRGFYVARHSHSLLVMAHDKLVGTVHVYEDSCRLNIYKPSLEENANLVEAFRELVKTLCSHVEERFAPKFELSNT